jgi:single-strand DNA-binding protein
MVEFRQTALLANFVIATNEFRGSGASERTEYHNLVAWDRLAEVCGQFLSKGQLIDVEGRLQTRQWDDDAGVRHWKTEIVVVVVGMSGGHRRRPRSRSSARRRRACEFDPSKRFTD